MTTNLLQRTTENRLSTILEYVLVHRDRNGQRYVYSGEGREGQPFLMGLIDPAKRNEPPSLDAPMPPTPSIVEPTPSIGT